MHKGETNVYPFQSKQNKLTANYLFTVTGPACSIHATENIPYKHIIESINTRKGEIVIYFPLELAPLLLK